MKRTFMPSLAFALCILIFTAPFAQAGVYEKDRMFLPQNFPLKFCWWGTSYVPKSDLMKKIEKHIFTNLTVVEIIQLNEDWPACESQPEGTTDKFVGVLPFDSVAFDNPKAREEVLKKHSFFEYYVFDHEKTPGHPRAHAFGKFQDLSEFDVILSFRFQKVRAGLVRQAANLSEQGKENLILSIALHEVLHVFGAVHEHLHYDSACTIEGEEPFAKGREKSYYSSFLLSDRYDADSLMDYCKTKTHSYEESPLQMSPGDIEALRTVYSE